MKLGIIDYFLLFMIYSIAGWILEVVLKYKEHKRFIDRGFLIGPYCPIYGYGALLITVILYRYQNDPMILFFMTIFISGILEYFTSWAMEKLFKARWWDYSKRKFNIEGRVCLGTLIPFGIFGLIITYITNPFLLNCLNSFNRRMLNVISVILFIIFIIDNIISTIIITGFRKTTIKVEKEETYDNTEEITKRVRAILAQKSWGYKRLIDAFPSLKTITTKIHEFTEEVKENVNEIKDNINEKAEDIKHAINDKTEVMKNTIASKTENMRNTINDKKNSVIADIHKNSSSIKIRFNLNKAKLKRKFFGTRKKRISIKKIISQIIIVKLINN